MDNTPSSMTVPTTATSKKRNTTTLETRIEILTLLKNGKKARDIANMFNMTTDAIYSIRKCSPHIMNFNLSTVSGDRKRLRKPQNELVEEAVLIWFNQMSSVGTSITGPQLASKSVEFYGHADKNNDFKASAGWLRNFKLRSHFRKSLGQGETPSAGSSIAEEYIESSAGKYQKINIYNADETVLLWKHLPGFNTTFEKNNVTLLVCTNSTGSHKLKLAMIGQYLSSQVILNFTQANPSPLNYFHSPNAWMTSTLFETWFINHFTQEVADYQEGAGIVGDVLLLIDSATCHPKIKEVTVRNINFKVKFLSPNFPSLLQPMDQGITTMLKKYYRRILLQQSLFVEPGCLENYYAKLDFYDCIQFLARAWELVSPKAILNCWKLPDKRKAPKDDDDKISEECLALLNAIPGYQHCTLFDVSVWMNSEQGEYPFRLLSDLEILEEAKNNMRSFESEFKPVFKPKKDSQVKKESQVKKFDPEQIKSAYKLVIDHVQTLNEVPFDVAILEQIYSSLK